MMKLSVKSRQYRKYIPPGGVWSAQIMKRVKTLLHYVRDRPISKN